MKIKILKKMFWKLPIPGRIKENLRMRYAEKKIKNEALEDGSIECVENEEVVREYAEYVLSNPTYKNKFYRAYEPHKVCEKKAILIAYYLTQYAPDNHNDKWWGRGTTEWNNVSKAVPQFVGHRQPRLPGELGFYDLRIRAVMERQIEIAKNYGIEAFSFYYYWFAGERILEKTLNMFLNDKDLDMPFIFCWANENWTRRFSGTDADVLIGMENTVENYKAFIHEVMPYFSDERYLKINGKFILQIYRPNLIPEIEDVISYWRAEVKKHYNTDLYLIACQEADVNWMKNGFDAENEWMQGSIKYQCKDITKQVIPVRKDFSGEVIDYRDMVLNKKYIIASNRKRKVYPAIMPFWDNSPRRNHRGIIWQNSTPRLYKQWLIELIKEVNLRSEKKELDSPLIFVNAWNEWGEGAYLEPDRDFGYAYLQATWEALCENE